MTPSPPFAGRAARRRSTRRRSLLLAGGLVAAALVAVGALTGLRGAGGRTSGASPAAAGSPSGRPPASPTASPSPSPPPYVPPRIAPVIRPALAGEGVWHRAVRWVPGGSPMRLAWYRPDPADPAALAYVAWIDTTRTHLALYPGWNNPAPGIPGPRTEEVPMRARPRLLATFNSGFYLQGPPGFEPGLTIPGGFAVNGVTYTPFVKGLATVVAYTDGRVNVIAWWGGRTPGKDVVMARQNFPLIVRNGRPTPALSVSEAWGSTLAGAPAVWRTALGVDAHGDLVYVAASQQTAPSLAQIMIHIGAVRAMQLDINTIWPIFVVFKRPGAGVPSMFVPNPSQIPTRFLNPSQKDFFAVYLARTTTYRKEPF